MFQEGGEVALVLPQALPHLEAAHGAEVPFHLEGVGVVGVEGPELLQKGLPEVLGQEVKGFLVHGAGEGAFLRLPVEGEEPALFGAAVGLEALLQEAGDGALGRAHGTVEEEDAPFGA